MMDPDVEFIDYAVHAHAFSRSARQRRKATFVPEDVIELYDSAEERALLALSVEGSARSAQKSIPSDQVPLFLPDEPDSDAPMQRVAAAPQDGASSSDPNSAKQPLQDSDCDRYVAQVAEIIPDADPAYVALLIKDHFNSLRDGVLEAVLHQLFENPDYPKLTKDKGKGKRKREDADDEGGPQAKVKIDYASRDRPAVGGPHYDKVSEVRLTEISWLLFVSSILISLFPGTTRQRFPPCAFAIHQESISTVQLPLCADVLVSTI